MKLNYESHVAESYNNMSTVVRYRELQQLLIKAGQCNNMSDCKQALSKVEQFNFWLYYGSSHVAIHQLNRSTGKPYDNRIVIITE